MGKKYFIKTYGCQMNRNDSERLKGVLEAGGCKETSSKDDADIILVNTCVVRQNAQSKASAYISSLKHQRSKKKGLIIGVCGCITPELGEKERKKFPHVDIFIAPNEYEKLFEVIGFPKTHVEPARESTVTAWVTIMEGCDNFCSYCIVPYVRGREKSRTIEDIMAEIGKIDASKHKEIFLLGQNVNSYKYGLAKLLKNIDDPALSMKWKRGVGEGLPRIRFMTNHPKDMSDEIINAVAETPNVCEYFHLPIQHGDDEMLKMMNRGYDIAHYKKIVEKIRAKMPGAAITSDIIVGYPGETDKQFRNSLKIIKDIGFDAVNTAVYSPRPGTAASKLQEDVPDSIKQERLQQIMEAVDASALKTNEALVGTIREILVEEYDGKYYKGRTRTNKIVKFTAAEDNLIGELINVNIVSVKSWILQACLPAGREKL